MGCLVISLGIRLNRSPMNKLLFYRIIILSAILLISSCASYRNHVNPMDAPPLASQLVHGPKATEYRQSEMISAGIGALGNSFVAEYQNRLESELRRDIQASGIQIHRQGNVVHLSLPIGVTFTSMGAELSPQFYPVLDTLAEILRRYQQTMIEVIGYMDADTVTHHRLPDQRASEISSYLVAQQLRHERFEIVGLNRHRRAQAEIRLLPLQRTVSRQPREHEVRVVNTGLFMEL